MASKKRKREVVGRPLDEEALVEVLRAKAQTYLRLPNVTSVGVGRRIQGDEETDELCIQFTVGRKLEPEQLQAEGLTALPETIRADDGTEIPVDVIERSFEPTYRVVSDPEAALQAAELTPRETRRSRLDRILPGISVSHVDGTAGTFGAVVYDNETGDPYILSNWHVLQGPTGALGDQVVQPGPFDDSDVDQNGVGRLTRSHLGLAGDCAISSIEGRSFDEEVLELDVAPSKSAKVNLGDQVVKSGRTTGVTRGIVRRIGVVVNLNYGQPTGLRQIGGFEIGPDPDNPPPDGEVSKGGDSGSLWLIDDGAPTDIAVGLHFAGETDPTPSAEHAIACNIHSVLEKLDVSFVEPDEELMDEEDLWNQILAILRALGIHLQSIEQRVNAAEQLIASSPTRPAERSPVLAGLAAPEGLPIYGNWCGPGHGGGTAVDDLDRACQRHDRCYGRKGYFDCACDAGLITDIDRALASGNVRSAGRAVGPLIRAWFTAQPCFYHIGRFKVPGGTGGTASLVRAGGTVVKKVKRAGKSVWKKVSSWF